MTDTCTCGEICSSPDSALCRNRPGGREPDVGEGVRREREQARDLRLLEGDGKAESPLRKFERVWDGGGGEAA